MAASVGGLERKLNFYGTLLVDASFDLKTFAGLNGMTALMQGIGIHGDSLSGSVGDVQVSSNIDALSSARVYQAWLQKDFGEGKVSLLAGIHDLNSEFYVTDASTMFLNSSFGVGPDLSATGKNGPSIFPEPGLATRARVRPANDWEVAAAVYDGVLGGSPVSAGEGALGIMEIAHSPKINGLDGRYAVAAWRYSAQEQVRGAYLLANQKVYSPDGSALLFAWDCLTTAQSRIPGPRD